MKVTVRSGQTLADIALQVCGGLEGVFDLARENGLNVTDELRAGQVLSYSKVIDKGVARYYEVNGISPATVCVKGGMIFDGTFDSTFE